MSTLYRQQLHKDRIIKYSSGWSGATQNGQPGEIYAKLPGKGNNDAQEPLLENASKITRTGQEVRAAGSEEAVLRTKTKQGVEGEAKDACSITSGVGWKIHELNRKEVRSCTSDLKKRDLRQQVNWYVSAYLLSTIWIFASSHSWISKLHLRFLNFWGNSSNEFFRSNQNKIFNENLLCHDHTDRWNPTAESGAGWAHQGFGRTAWFSRIGQANGRLPLSLRQWLVGPTGRFWPLWVHYLSQPAGRGDFTLFQHIFIPSPKFALKFIQALIVSLKFKSLVAYIQVALVKLTGGWNSCHSQPPPS